MFLSYKINSLQSLWARNGLLRLSDKLPHVIKTYLFLPFPISLLIYIKAANSCFKNKKNILLLFMHMFVWSYRWLGVPAVWVLGTELPCSVNVASVPNCWSISPAPWPLSLSPELWLTSCRPLRLTKLCKWPLHLFPKTFGILLCMGCEIS